MIPVPDTKAQCKQRDTGSGRRRRRAKPGLRMRDGSQRSVGPDPALRENVIPGFRLSKQICSFRLPYSDLETAGESRSVPLGPFGGWKAMAESRWIHGNLLKCHW